MTIRAIDTRTVERIASGQVITDLASAIKELIENGLDAGAKSLEVLFLGVDGLEAFEVADDGSGMEESDLNVLGQSHCTSKLNTFESIDGLESLGFRGEAFHSLCALSRCVTVTTRQPGAPHGLVAEYGAGGALLGMRPTACSPGTRVRITGLFHEYAVRLQEWKRGAKKALSKAVRVVQTFSIGFPQVRFRCSVSDAGRLQNLVASSGSGSFACALSEVLGVASRDVLQLSASCTGAHVEGVIGHLSSTRRSSPDRQFVFVNGHPSDQRVIVRACNEVFRERGIQDYPLLVLTIKLDAGECDVNLTPDKRAVSVFKERELADALREAVANAVFERLEMVPTVEGPLQSLLPFKSTTLVHVKEKGKREEEPAGTVEDVVTLDEGTQSACPCHVAPSLAEPIADSLCRDDLLAMEVIGQFNCGFILTRLLRNEGGSSSLLYIVDQHAADERFRLETLEHSENFSVQRLLMPKRFFLSATDALFVQDHLEELAKIGFEVISLPESGSFELCSVPQMTGVTLDLPDLLEIIHDWQGPEGALHRTDRIAAALASKACRSAVMIGAPLALPQMSTIVRNLAGLQKPWICAHGRPTVRLLYSERI